MIKCTLPREWKVHKMCLIFEGGGIHCANNYRPFSLLCILSKGFGIECFLIKPSTLFVLLFGAPYFMGWTGSDQTMNELFMIWQFLIFSVHFGTHAHQVCSACATLCPGTPNYPHMAFEVSSTALPITKIVDLLRNPPEDGTIKTLCRGASAGQQDVVNIYHHVINFTDV